MFPSLANFKRGRVGADALAGLTVWAVLIPEALAYATIAGVTPVVGLYAAVPALVLYAAFGSSRHLVVGPMAATAALSAAAVADVAAGNGSDFTQLTVGLALVTGVLGLVAGLARLGFLASFISEPVLKGFIIGLALTIIVGQLPKLFGVEGGEGNFFEKTWDLIGNLGDTQRWTLLVGVVSLAIVLGLRRLAPRVPGSLVAVLVGIVAVPLLDLDTKGVEVVGSIQAGLPSVGLPDLGWSDYGSLSASAVGILLVGFAEGLGAAKAYATRDHYTIDANRELIGLGAANLGSGLASGMVVNGSLSKTAVNGSAGARSQLSGLVVAALTVITLLFLTGAVREPSRSNARRRRHRRRRRAGRHRCAPPAVCGLHGPARRDLRAGNPRDLIAALAALFGVLLFDTLPGLFIGIAVSVLLLVYRASRPTSPCSANSAVSDTGSMSPAIPTPPRLTESWWCGPRAACSTATPTTSTTRSATDSTTALGP